MIFFKWLGMALLLAVGAAVGCARVSFVRARRRQAAGFLSLIGSMRSQVSLCGASMGQMLTTVDMAVLRDCGFEAKERPTDLATLMEAVTLWQSAEINRLLVLLAREFGRGGLTDQLRYLDDSLNHLAPYCRRQAAGARAEDRAAFFLPVALSALLILLLL